MVKMQKKRFARRGFTLVEVVTTIFIIGLLVMLVLPNVQRVRSFAETKQAEAMVQTVQTQIDLYRAETMDTDVTMEELTKDGKYLSVAQAERVKKLGIHIDKGTNTAKLVRASGK
jgi:competence protein ComGC